MAAGTTRRTGLRVEGVNEAVRALRRLDKENDKRMRAASQEIAQRVADKARGNASSRLEAMSAESFRASRDRFPVVKAGGGKRLNRRPGSPATYGDVYFGAEFGGGTRPTTRQFPAPRAGGTMLYPAIGELSDWIMDEYGKALDRALRASGAD